MKRHGFTLVELIAVMAVVAVITGFSVVLLVQVLDYQRDVDEYANEIRSVDQFIVAFRNDIHTYGKPEILSVGNTLLRWKTESETIEYSLETGSFPEQQNIVRLVKKEEQKDQYEAYPLPNRTALHFVEGSNNDAGLVALSLWTAPKGTEMPNLDELNPFDRTLPTSLDQRVDPKYAGNWRTIIARY